MVIAETERLFLRQLTPDDASDLFRIYSDALVMQYMGAAPATVEQERANTNEHTISIALSRLICYGVPLIVE